MCIGENIKKLRKEKGYTQEKLAKESNISRSYLGDIEKNRYNPSLEVLKAISNSLNAPLTLLLEKWDEEYNQNNKLEKEVKNIEFADKLSEKDIITMAAHKVGHEGDLTKEELEKVKLALKIALMKEDK